MQNKPNLHFGSALFLNAWFELDQERERPNPLTRTLCFQYAYDYDLDLEQRDELWIHIRHMDTEFLDWWRKKQPKKRAPKGGKL